LGFARANLRGKGKIMQPLKQGATIAAFAAIVLTGLGVGTAAAADIPPQPPQYGPGPAYPPPTVYAPPPVYYAPPPVVVVPGPYYPRRFGYGLGPYPRYYGPYAYGPYFPRRYWY
jgi:hypothetical protein